MLSAMKPGTTALERAFQLARTGAFPSVSHIKSRLTQEGYSCAQITGRVLTKQLGELIKKAREPDA